jgi:hypothetical protein
VVSFRTSKGERDRMRAEARELGLKTLTDLCRYRFGFPLGEPGSEPLTDADLLEGGAIEDKTAIVLAHLIDRFDEFEKRQTRIARYLGVREDPPREPKAPPPPAPPIEGFLR